jgi:hypothetical protein
MNRYRHTQVAWVTNLALGAIAILVASTLASAGVLGGAVVAALICIAIVALFGWLTVSVGDNVLEARFGVGLIKKRVDLSDIRAYGVVRNRWYWGWGIRFYPRGMLYNVAGLSAVELTLRDGKELRIGTDEPERLAAVLKTSLGKSLPLTPEEEVVKKRRAFRWRLTTAAITLVILAGVGGLIYAEMQPPKAVVDASGFHVSSAVYGVDVPLHEIVSVSLESQLPRILARTNGTGAGRTLRGHFRLEGLGDGQLFLEYGSPPYLLVRTRDSFVYVGFEDPAKTRRLHAELEASLAGRAARALTLRERSDGGLQRSALHVAVLDATLRGAGVDTREVAGELRVVVDRLQL